MSKTEKAIVAAGCFWGVEELFRKLPGVTEITKAGPFYRAEEYHQKYFLKNGGENCHI